MYVYIDSLTRVSIACAYYSELSFVHLHPTSVGIYCSVNASKVKQEVRLTNFGTIGMLDVVNRHDSVPWVAPGLEWNNPYRHCCHARRAHGESVITLTNQNLRPILPRTSQLSSHLLLECMFLWMDGN